MFLVEQWHNLIKKKYKKQIKLLIIEESDVLDQAIQLLDQSLFKVFRLFDFNDQSIKEKCALFYYEQRKNKDNISLEDAYRSIESNPINFASALIGLNYVDILILGIIYDSKSCFSSILKLLKNPDNSTAYSTMVMYKDNELIFMSDCALNISINKEQIKPLVNYSYLLAKQCFFIDQNYAGLISYQTNNDYSDSSINLLGSLQFDALVDPKVRAIKLANSHNHIINHYIFLDLITANTIFKIYAYKMNYLTIGSYIHNIQRSISVLSRSATVDEIVATVYLLGFDFVLKSER